MPAPPRFVVDVNVGRLAKWLRVMGYDTLFPENNSDNELVRLALRENRVLVTRDAGIPRRRAVKTGEMQVELIEADDLRSQLRQLVNHLDLNQRNGFSRCVLCNAVLAPVDKETIAHKLPAYVLQTQTQFTRCPCCCRVYWRGTHWANMMAELDEICRERN